MKKLVVQEKYNYDYILVDDNSNKYFINMEFYSNYIPMVNDIIYMDDSVLNENNLFSFNEIKDITSSNEKDIIKVVSGSMEYYFQRVYG